MQRQAIGKLEFEANPSIKHCPDDCPFSSCEAVECIFNYPLKIIIPKYAGIGCCKWVYPITFGGGLVEGDTFKIEVVVKENCSVLWTTQSFTKVYSCENNKECIQELKYTIHSRSLLCVLPDPVVCFKDARYRQYQEVNLNEDSNLVLLDWFTSGRQARNEHWDFKKYQSMTIVKIGGKIVLREAISMEDTPFLTKRDAMKMYAVVGMCIILGPYLSEIVTEMLHKLSAREPYGQVPRNDLILSISPYYYSSDSKPLGCVLRFSSVSTYQAYSEIINIFQPIFKIVGGNPFEHK